MSSPSKFNSPSKGGLKKREGQAGQPKEPELPVQPVMPNWVPEIVGMPRPKFISLIELKNRGECRWPYGDRDFLFCGLPCGAKTYCRWHMQIRYRGRPIGV